MIALTWNGEGGSVRRSHDHRWRSNSAWRLLRVERLESRQLLSLSTAGFAVPLYVGTYAGTSVEPLSTAGPTGYSPQQIRQAYGFDNITFQNGTITGNGAGTTIAIVDAYDDPTIANDLRQFDRQYGLTDPIFTKVNQWGSATSLPAANHGWATEIALDVEWAHAIAPGANILLVEANSNSMGDLLTAVNYARSAPGVVAVSMSWGGGEFAAETSVDSYFTTPAGHIGVTFLAASGDSGAPVDFPAVSPNVLAVGGTTLNLDASGNYRGESGWSGSGGGTSSYESQPGYQDSVVTQTGSARTNPDVAYDADPNTGFSVYDSYNNPLSAPWGQWGGTSDAAPQWAGLIAIADQGLMLAGQGSLDGATQLLPKLYALPSSDFHDVTGGSSLGHPAYAAGTGYDLVTGRGSPRADLIVAALVGVPAASGSLAGSTYTSSSPASSAISTPGLYDPATGTFRLRNSLSSGTADEAVVLGNAGTDWIPLVGDWTGNGTVSVGLYDPATSTFYLKNSLRSGTADETVVFGKPGAGWIPLVGDWTGNGIDSIGLYDPATSTFRLKNTLSGGTADERFVYGRAGGGWIPVAGDWTGNGVDTIGLYDSSTTLFRLKNSLSGGTADERFAFGTPDAGWVPLVGNWTGSGAETVGLYDPSSATFRLRNSLSGGAADELFTLDTTGTGWIPIVGDWTGYSPSPLTAWRHSVATVVAFDTSRTNAASSPTAWPALNDEAVPAGQLTVDDDMSLDGPSHDSPQPSNEVFASPRLGPASRATDPRAVDRIDFGTLVDHLLERLVGPSDGDGPTDVVPSDLLA
jgi:hypothetical protein